MRFKKLLSCKRTEYPLCNHIGKGSQTLKKIDTILEEQLSRSIALDPLQLDSYLALGDLLHRKRDEAAAVNLYCRALTVLPTSGELYHNLGNSLLALRSFAEALAAYTEASRLLPDFAESHVTAATVLQAMGRPQEALDQCDRALVRDPDLAEAHWNRALALLQLGNYTEGWREFEWRWQKRSYTTDYRDFPQPRWQGEILAGRTILVHAEQAFGDIIMFSRFLPLVGSRGGIVICECPAPLVRLIQLIPGVTTAVAAGSTLPAFDCHVPLLSLQLVFGVTLENLPEYPTARPFDRTAVSVWQQRMRSYHGLRVGIVWAGRSFPDPARSCPFRFLAPLGSLPGVTFFSLQIGIGADEVPAVAQILPLVDLSVTITDFADTAALIQNLDLVITIDTAVAHLAGTLGCPTWILLPFAADWRWLQEREDSPWYPSVRLFRQNQADDWPELICRVRNALSARLSTGATASFEEFYERGIRAVQRGDLSRAWLLLERARDLNGSVPELYNALGVLATCEEEPEKAERLLRQAIVLDPGYADPLINLGNLMYETERYHDSAKLLLRAVEISPESSRGWQNLGVVFQGCGRIREAFSCFHRAVMLDPDHATARWNLANLELLTGDYENGWRNFEARFLKTEPVACHHQELPRWQGDALAGRRLLVSAEQGYGDTIQCARYLPLLSRFGGTVIFDCPDRSLFSLVEGISGVDHVSVRGEAVAADCHIPLLSLPAIFGTRLDSIPDEMPYLQAPCGQTAAWRERIANGIHFHVGLCWSGRPKPDPRRSCTLQQMAPLAAVADVTFHSLQLGSGAEQAASPPSGMILHDDTGQLVDFGETAALISTLDLVISIDSAVAHLAGALGRPTWLLLPFAPDWRWLLERENSPWYPTMRLFRQKQPGGWHAVMERVAAELGVSAAIFLRPPDSKSYLQSNY